MEDKEYSSVKIQIQHSNDEEGSYYLSPWHEGTFRMKIKKVIKIEDGSEVVYYAFKAK